ncbi:MAG: ferrous iron transport protein A [Elusimicrobiota bacterium]
MKHMRRIKHGENICKLSELEIGLRAEIVDIIGQGEIIRRLLDMGFVIGTCLRVEREAPLGDPIYVCMRGSCITLRKNEADLIIVERLGMCHGKKNRYGRGNCR